jgi:23S rRNA (adenine2503-C2)-methyltransferase
MANISKKNKQWLDEYYVVGRTEPVSSLRSEDGTVKYLFNVGDGKKIESVYIPDKDRATLCVSSQVGCKMGCAFCMTGRQGFNGSLSASEILNQIYALPQRERLTNIVFMGQGEPFDNYEAVLRATQVLTEEWGFGWSPKRITVSTVGLKKGLQRFLDESKCHLAISLHHPLHEGRSALMPAERAYSVAEMVALLSNYDFCSRRPVDPSAPKQRRLSFEYIVFRGINDSMEHARALVNLLRDLDCRINLIRFHDIPDTPLHGVDDAAMVRFRDYLTSHGLFTTIRASRGQDIYAACGLLSTKKEEEERNQATDQA